MATMSGMCALRKALFLHCAKKTKAMPSLTADKSNSPKAPPIHRSFNSVSAVLLTHRHRKVPTNVTFSFVSPLALHSCLYSQTSTGTTEDILKSRQPQPQPEKEKSDSDGQHKGGGDKKKEQTIMTKYGVWLGLASLTLSFVSSGGYLYLYIWGTYCLHSYVILKYII